MMRLAASKNRQLFLLCLILLCLITANAQAGSDLSGYWKAYLQLLSYPAAEFGSLSFGIDEDLALANRLRLKYAADLTESIEFETAYDFSPRIYLSGGNGGSLSTPGYGIGSQIYRIDDFNSEVWKSSDGDYSLHQNLDRLQLTWRLPRADLIIGRQAIAWGSARAVNPTDILAPFAYGEIDVEDRVGVDALRLRVPLGLMGELDGGWAFGQDGDAANSAWFLRGKYFLARTDFYGIVSGFRGNLLLGLDLTRALGGFGSWLEAGYVIIDKPLPGEKDYLRLSLGADYSLPDGTYLFAEYHYNGAGSDDPSGYLRQFEQTAYREGAVYLLGRHYLIPGVSHPITPLLTANLQVIANFDYGDPSAYTTLTLEYNLTENSYLSLGVYKSVGKGPYALSLHELTTPRLRSEFGSYSDLYYLSYRTYF